MGGWLLLLLLLLLLGGEYGAASEGELTVVCACQGVAAVSRSTLACSTLAWLVVL